MALERQRIKGEGTKDNDTEKGGRRDPGRAEEEGVKGGMPVAVANGTMHAVRRDLLERCAAFSARLLRFYGRERKRGVVPHSLLQQALRSGTAIGAHSAEAESAITRRHLIALRAGALREAREAQYWFHLIEQSGLCGDLGEIGWLYGEATDLVAILTTSVQRLRDLP